MTLFVIFIFGAVVIGAGAMLAPAWNTAQPRIGLAAALALGLIMGGAIFWAALFGWNTLVIDYLLFALVTTIFLGGTLSYGQRRAEKLGLTLSDTEQGWPGPRDLLFFGLAALVFIAPALVLPVPMGTDAQGFGYLGLMARMGGGFQSLAPWHPEISYLYSPGLPLLIAYLSQQLGQGMHTIQFALAAVLGVLLVWLAYDLGSEIRDKRLGRAMAVTMLGGLGLYLAYLDSHFTTLLGLVFALACITYALRYQRDRQWPDAVAAGLMLGAVVLSHPDTTIILGLGYVPWLLTMWFGKPRPTLRTTLVLALGVPLLAALAISPWLLSIRDLLGADIQSPFRRSPDYWRMMIFYHGVWVVPAAVVGAVAGLRGRSQAAILAVGWLALALDFASLGLLERFVPWLIAPVLRYDYPFSIAWHAPIIPYSILGGMGLLWAWDRWLEPRLGARLHRGAYALLGGLIVIGLAALVFNRQLLDFSKGRLGIYGAFSSQADVQAMEWLRDNTPPGARVLNFPGTLKDNSHESDWVPVISERDSVYYRWQPFFRGNEASLAEQERMRAFWQNPADPALADLLREAGIGYVIVPQIVTDPASIESQFRWGEPFADDIEMYSSLADAPYLRQVFEADGALVYEVLPGG
ncbi:MAG: hypothetical protein HXY41_08000 [Chloroflexi bacterium]|nr:hypothetical protein [Chloroflexota bacterium]